MHVYVLTGNDDIDHHDDDDFGISVFATLESAKRAAEDFAAEAGAQPLEWRGGTNGWGLSAEVITDGAEGFVYIETVEVKP